MKKNLKNKKGFTLVEIIVVLVIIAILAAATVPAMIGFVEEARGKAFIAEARVGLVAAQAVVTEITASGRGTVATGNSGTITYTPADAAAPTTVLATSTFANMVQDVTGATYVPAASGTPSSLSVNPFKEITVTADNRVTGVVYNTAGAPAADVGPAGSYTIRITNNTATVTKNTPAGS